MNWGCCIDGIVLHGHCLRKPPLCWTLETAELLMWWWWDCHQHCCDVLASAAGGAPPLSLSSHVRVHQTWIQYDPLVLSNRLPPPPKEFCPLNNYGDGLYLWFESSSSGSSPSVFGGVLRVMGPTARPGLISEKKNNVSIPSHRFSSSSYAN